MIPLKLFLSAKVLIQIQQQKIKKKKNSKEDPGMLVLCVADEGRATSFGKQMDSDWEWT